MAAIQHTNTINENSISYRIGNELNDLGDLKRKIVIVDDEATGRMILGKILQQIMDNIEIYEFEHPQDLLVWLEDNHPDLIVTDYRMPELNGIELIRKIRTTSNCLDIPIVMITIADDKTVLYDALEAGTTAFLTRPIDRLECRISCRNLLKLNEQRVITQRRAEWLEKQVELASNNIALREKETLSCLTKLGEYRDSQTTHYGIRIAKCARQIAEALGWSASRCDEFEYAAPMHDIGKVAIADNILLKPAKLADEQWQLIKQHSEIGHNILAASQSKYMRLAATIALAHHEKFDGTGYPYGLKGEQIPLAARIVSVADVYNALMAAKPYRKAWSKDQAIGYIKQQSGKHFDPQCARAFLARLPEIDKINLAYPDKLAKTS